MNAIAGEQLFQIYFIKSNDFWRFFVCLEAAFWSVYQSSCYKIFYKICWKFIMNLHVPLYSDVNECSAALTCRKEIEIRNLLIKILKCLKIFSSVVLVDSVLLHVLRSLFTIIHMVSC